MKIFAVYLRVNLTHKPDWFDRFREENDGWFELHITLIQSRYIREEQAEEVKSKAADVLAQLKPEEKHKKVVFDKPKFERLPDGRYLLMWFAENNIWLAEIQKKLKTALESYDNYCDKAAKEYEKYFNPHITVAESVDITRKEEVEKKLCSDSRLEGELTGLVVPVVKDGSREEREKRDNLTIFGLD